MILKNGLCACCGKKQTMEFDNEPFTQELNMSNYIKFRQIKLNQCSNCGYVAENLFEEIDDSVKGIVNSTRYKNLLNYGYMGDFKELPDKEYLNLDINRLEVFALLVRETGNNLISARVLAQIADLKLSLSQTYLETKVMKEDEELDESYDKLIELLESGSQNNNEECLNFLRGIKISDALIKVFVAERLCFSCLYDQGKQIIEKLNKKFTFSKDLSKYIENFLTEVEER